MKKNKLTRYELNEQSWQRKKLKKKKGLARGSRANPNQDKVKADNALAPQGGSKATNRAIPLYIPGKDTPLVAEGLPVKSTKVSRKKEAEIEARTAPTSGSSVDMVVANGKLVTSKELEQKHKATAKATKVALAKEEKKASQAKSKAKAKTSGDFEQGSKKLGKAALRRLEREEVALGDDIDFFKQASKIQEAKVERTTAETATNDRKSAIKSRDYKAGRNTDYVATQAAAEKSLKPLKKKRKLSGEELLDAWENIKW